MVLGLLLVVAFFNIFLYILDKVVTPTVMAVADAEMRAKSMEIINT